MKGNCQFNAVAAVAQPSNTRHPLNRDWIGFNARVIKALSLLGMGSKPFGHFAD